MNPVQDKPRLLILALVALASLDGCAAAGTAERGAEPNNEFPDGYFPFEESAARIPPKVRRPPYAQADVDCPGTDRMEERSGGIDQVGVQSLDNLCGDLNKGYLPKNPMKRDINGHSYPFELIRNKTLDFFSGTLPILKEDRNLPKVAKYDDFDLIKQRSITKRHVEPQVLSRRTRSLCQKNYGVFCTIYKLVNGRFSAQRVQERAENEDDVTIANSDPTRPIGDSPLTPCPSAAEYVTPVYAKNYQGVWRYVVQIPYEGYFTQTVEVTKCLRKKCHFMDGSCLASPRWLSLLVAELFYPHARFPATKPGPSFRSMNSKERKRKTPPQPLTPHSSIPLQLPAGIRSSLDEEDESDHSSREKRHISDSGSSSSAPAANYCDGVDDIGCYQVRLYYDWFLVPGSCKCWKQDFFTKYGRK